MTGPLRVWKRTDKCAPASGGSTGFAVECPATGEVGHFKPVNVYQEVLACALASEVGVPVPPTTLGNCEDKTGAVSRYLGGKSMDARKLKEHHHQDYASDAFKSATKQASGLLPFNAWTGTGDPKDDHVVVASAGPGQYMAAGVDFANGFSFDATGGQVTVPTSPPALVADGYRDPQVAAEAIQRINALTEERITEIVGAIPDSELPPAEKNRITSGLIARRQQLEPKFREAGWLPAPETQPTEKKEPLDDSAQH